MPKPLVVNSVSKNFREKQVLKDVSVSVEEGEIFGLIGLNGAGKTTLIKIILSLLAQDKGDVSFFGKSAANTQSRKNINYLPEKFYPSQFLKGMEFLDISLAYYGLGLDVEAAREKAVRLGLEPDVLSYRVGKYSKGMGQKLGLLSMFLGNTPMLILDEPMSGLDPRARIQLKDMLVEYKKQGNTIFFSSHILSDIEEICDKIAVIHDGEIIFSGKPASFMKSGKTAKNLERAFLEAIGG